MNFAILPNLIALAVLVAVFWAIARKATSRRLYWWLAGWILVLLHFTAEFLLPIHGVQGQLLVIASVDCLLLAAIVFLVSFSSEDPGRPQFRWALCIAAPTVAYGSGAACEVLNENFYFAIIAGGALVGYLCFWREFSKSRLWLLSLLAVVAGLVIVTAWALSLGIPRLGIAVIMAGLTGLAAMLFAISYRRLSAGIVTTVIGFSLWGAVFPLTRFLKAFAPTLQLARETWNIPEYVVAVGMILTLFENQIETSKYHAYHDELTGLPNRRLLEDRLGLSLAYARRAKTKLAVLQLDLNRFKEVNDTYGHRAGDVALREVAHRLAACVQSGDTLARSGGDEFTVIAHLRNRDSADALVVALETTLAAPILIDGKEVQTGLSIGIAVYPDDGVDQDQLHAAADRAMYAVKRAGRTPVGDDVANEGISIGGDQSVTMMPTPR